MNYRVLKGWADILIAFANFQFRSQDRLKAGLINAVGKDLALRFWEEDAKARSYRVVIDLQRLLIRYLKLVAEPQSRGKPEISSGYLEEIIEDLEEFGSTTPFTYDVLRVEESTKLYRELKGVTPVPVESGKIKISRFPTCRSLEQLVYTSLLEAFITGEIWKIRCCRNVKCRKFVVAKRLNRRSFCCNPCRFSHHNQQSARKETNKERQKQTRAEAKKCRQREVEQNSRRIVLETFERLLRSVSKNNVQEDGTLRRLLRKLGGGSPLSGRQDAKKLAKEWIAGVPLKAVWDKLPNRVRDLLEDDILSSA